MSLTPRPANTPPELPRTLLGDLLALRLASTPNPAPGYGAQPLLPLGPTTLCIGEITCDDSDADMGDLPTTEWIGYGMDEGKLYELMGVQAVKLAADELWHGTVRHQTATVLAKRTTTRHDGSKHEYMARLVYTATMHRVPLIA